MGKDLQGSGRGLILRYYPGTCLEVLRKTTKTSVMTAGHRPRSEPGTSRVQHRSVNHSTMSFDVRRKNCAC
jgi:hypothetical protein